MGIYLNPGNDLFYNDVTYSPFYIDKTMLTILSIVSLLRKMGLRVLRWSRENRERAPQLWLN